MPKSSKSAIALQAARDKISGKFTGKYVFDFDFIAAHRKQGPNKMLWREIADHYGCKDVTVINWYQREKKKIQKAAVRKYHAQKSKKKLKQIKNRPAVQEEFTPISDTSKNIIQIALPDLSIENDPKFRYGSLEPTGYKWTDDSVAGIMKWARRYTQYNWDNENIRENIRTLYQEVLINGKSTLIIKPRDSGKTKSSIIVYAFILANTYLPQLVIVNGSKAKKRIFYAIRHIFHSDRFRQDYGDIVIKESIQDGDILLHNSLVPLIPGTLERYVTDDPPFQLSTYSSIVGSHPYVAYLEDILQSEYKSAESNEYMLDEVFDSIIANMTDRIGGTATRKGMTDLYSFMPSRGVRLLVRKAMKLVEGRWPTIADAEFIDGVLTSVKITGEFKIIDRPGWTVQSLLLKYLKNPHKFEREMQNNPQPREGQYFEKSDWVVIPPDEALLQEIKTGRIPTWTFTDPAYGKSSAADFTSIIVVTVLEGRLHIIDGLLKQAVRDIPYEISRFDHYFPQFNCVDDNWNQLRLAQLTSEFRTVEHILPYKTSIDKVDRISGLYRWFRERKIVIWNTFPNLPEAYKQFVEFDEKQSNALKKDDFLDTVAMAVEKLKHRFTRNTKLQIRTF